jgi:beta-phosphoglucomutase family hydrolase
VQVLGLPDPIRACLFDLDGVLTETASVHAAAWKEMFDAFLSRWARRTGEPLVPFDPVQDYDAYVDGKPRADGTRAFLDARGIGLPEGSPNDPPDAETIHGLGNRKNEILLRRLRTEGVHVYPGSARYLRAVREAGLQRAVVSASANTHDVLRAAGIADEFQVVIDGVVADKEHLRGKPAPDPYLAAAARLQVDPRNASVFEDALAGVEAGRGGGFGFVIGVDRVGQRDALLRHGADIVVDDLSDLLDRP